MQTDGEDKIASNISKESVNSKEHHPFSNAKSTNESVTISKSRPSSSKSHVDAAFERMFGYPWGSSECRHAANNKRLTESSPSMLQQQMAQIFGPVRAMRIIRGMNTSLHPGTAASTLTPKIVHNKTTKPIRANIPSSTRPFKKKRIDVSEYKNIRLPKHIATAIGNKSVPAPSSADTALSNGLKDKLSASKVGDEGGSSIDNVLKQISGKKKVNTVEKSSNDWEGFKKTNKALQDELERTAQSKDAYLVKQDFLNRVDQRKFELEKSEREIERSRREAAASR